MQTNLSDFLCSGRGRLRMAGLLAATAVLLAWIVLGAAPKLAAQVPPAPSNLAAVAVSASEIDLTWMNNLPLGNEIRVFRSTDGMSFSQVNTLPRTATTYNDTGLIGSVTYFYQVRAHNAAGDSDPSNTGSDATWPLLQLDDVCPGQITVAWRSAGVDDHYSIQRSTTGNPDDFTEIATVPAPGNRYTDSGLSDGTYFYRIQAFRTASSPLSNRVRTTLGGSGSAIDHSDGFADHGDLTNNGNATFVGNFLQLTDAVGGQVGSAFYSQPPTPQVDISNFSTSFTFRLHDPQTPDAWADGMAFVIHNDLRGPDALGPAGGGLGYGPDQNTGGDCRAGNSIRNSVAIKLDIWNNVGEGTNSTGIFTDGRSPTLRCPGLGAEFPDNSVDMEGTPIQLRDNHPKQVDLSYDGNTLTETITDLVTLGKFTATYTVDIPSLVGGSTAYVGFTGATGGVWAVHEVQTWTFGGTPSLFPRSPKGLRVTNVTPSDTGSDVKTAWKCNNPRVMPQGFRIERSDNGGDYTLINTVDASQLSYTDQGVAEGSYCYRVRAFNDQGDSSPSNVYCLSLPVPALVDHSAGFASHDDLKGNASPVPTRVIFTQNLARLTTGGFGQAGSVFSTGRVDITSFTNTFTFQICVTTPSCATSPPGEGITFTIQGNAPTALGSSGAGSLGYSGLNNSVAVKFDLFNNQGETDNSTGLFTDGHSPTLPSPGSGDVNVPIDKTVLDFKSQDPFTVSMTYDASTLTLNVTITDAVTGNAASQSYTVDIPSAVGSNLAYVGFTGSTSNVTARQDAQTWTFQSGFPAPGFSTE
jgi:lectin family protein/legume-like lectin family protein/fibronectin type III domain protein